MTNIFKTLLFISILFSFSFILFTKKKVKKCPDLTVREIQEPHILDSAGIKYSVIKVTIQNIGKLASKATSAKIYDIDLNLQQAKDLFLRLDQREIIEENRIMADKLRKKDPNNPDITDSDYDKFVEDSLAIPALNSGEITTVTFVIKEHWVYDPYCELEVEVDFEDGIVECNEINNKKQYFSKAIK